MTADEIFLDSSRYYLSTEYLGKLRLCIGALPEGSVWQRPNESCNSIANLLLHLAGNVRQWIVNGIGGEPVERDRAAEFSARNGSSAAALFDNLESAVEEADAVLARLTADDLTRPCDIQGRETTVLAAIYHVVEHFAMHTGQIVLLTKVYAPDAIHFYDDSGWKANPLWGGSESHR
jgi:uncharacterized damage-inducible protein DinB